MGSLAGKIIDVHFHVGLLGDSSPNWGAISGHFQREIAYKVFLLYARIPADKVCDRTLREATERMISEADIDHVVCLALDAVYDERGARRQDLSQMWVDNDYVLDLRRTVGKKVLLGASVHPYDPEFEDRVRRYVAQGAVLLKWLPSAQAINLADPRAAKAMAALAHLGPSGKALPLLLHCGGEYAIPPVDFKSPSRDFLSWSGWDAFWNRLRFSKAWHTPDVGTANANLKAAVDQGAVVIFAHCGLPYFASARFGAWLEHSDFNVVRGYLAANATLGDQKGRFYADVSACCTPFRKTYFPDIDRLPSRYVLFGSDFPTPVFELSANLGEVLDDFKAVLAGQLDRILVPQDNLLDVNRRELFAAFPGHPMFTNFGALCESLGITE